MLFTTLLCLCYLYTICAEAIQDISQADKNIINTTLNKDQANQELNKDQVSNISNNLENSFPLLFTSRLLNTCLSNEYLDNYSICQPCDGSCTACSGGLSTNCDSCGTNMTLSSSSTCDCVAGMYMDVSYVCQTCDGSCATCLDAGTDQCTSCTSASPNFRVQGTLSSNGTTFTCVCIDGYYQDSSFSCQQCNYKCATCSVSSTSCVDCAANRSLNSSSVCVCDSGYFEDSTASNACTACHVSCATCTTNSATSCSTCVTNRTYNSSSNLCECDGGYYESSNVCQSCDTSCATCSGGNDTDCVTCASNMSKNSTTSKCECNPGYYLSSPGTCNLCNSSCLTCFGGGASRCTTCKVNRILQSNNSCLCPSKYFIDSANSNACTACHATCATCSGSAVDTNCTSCVTNMSIDSSTSKCVCDAGYYLQSTANCQACDNTCLTCTSAGQYGCQTCQTNRVIQANFSCLCPTKYFVNTSASNACTACHASCADCTGNLETNCTSCTTNMTMNVTTSKCECDPGYYLYAAGDCRLCDYSCSTCSAAGALSCETCQTNRQYQTNKSCLCPDKFFEDSTASNACVACNYTCATCNSGGTTGCLICETNRVKQSNNSCLCPSNFFEDSTSSNACTACHVSCASCNGESDTSCTTCVANMSKNSITQKCECNPGYYLYAAGDCRVCHYTCATCDSAGATGCLTCKTNRIQQTDDSCLCPSSYFEDSTQSDACVACNSFCATCSGTSTTCTDCNSTRYLSGSSTCICNDGFYEQTPANPTCGSCDISCTTCNEGTKNDCLTCSATTKYRELLSSSTPTQCTCLDGYYEDSLITTGVCQACYFNCQKCQGPLATECSDCFLTNSYLPQSTSGSLVKCVCPDHYYEDTTNISCQPCDVSCDSCSGPLDSECLSCYSSHYRQLISNSCDCNDGMYSILTDLVCLPCDSTCLTCTGDSPFQCLSCFSSSNRSLKTPFYICECDDGFYEDYSGSTPTCVACQSPCVKCDGNSTTCLTCSDTNMTVVNGSCNCISGYFLNSSTCMQCSAACQTCVGSTDSDCLMCAEYYVQTATGSSSITCTYDQAAALQQTSINCDASCAAGKCELSDRSQCTTCAANRVISGVHSLCECIDGYFERESSRNCELCHYSCDTCTGETDQQCKQCGDSAVNFRESIDSYGGNVICQCKDGYYDIDGTNVCSACSPVCKTCNGSTDNCITCGDNAVLVQGTCQCEDGYFYIVSLSKCGICDHSCLECDGITKDSCLTCSSSTRYFNQLSTSVGTGLPMGSCPCASGTFNDGTNATCVSCDPSCQECETSPSNCVYCFAVENRTVGSNNACVCESHYIENLDGECLRCPYDCLECNLQFKCLSCDSSAMREYNSLTDRCDCKLHSFEQTDRTCQLCDDTCYTCVETSSKCLSCYPNASLNADYECECDSGYLLNASTGKCIKCKSLCLECDNSSECTSCDQSSRMTLNTTSLLCQCYFGYTLVSSEIAGTFYCVEESYISTDESLLYSLRHHLSSTLPIVVIIFQLMVVLSILLGRLQVADTGFLLFLEMIFLLYSDVAKPDSIRRILVVFQEQSFFFKLDSLNIFSKMVDPLSNQRIQNSYMEEFGFTDDLFQVGGGAITLGFFLSFLFLLLRATIFSKRYTKITQFSMLIPAKRIALTLYNLYVLNVFLILQKILSIIILFAGAVALLSDDAITEVIGIFVIVGICCLTISSIKNSSKFYDISVSQFQNLTSEIHGIQLMFFETLLYLIPFFLVSRIKGIYFCGWNIIFRSVLIIGIAHGRLASLPKSIKHTLLAMQILAIVLNANLGMVIIYSWESQLAGDAAEKHNICIIIFEIGVYLFACLTALIIGVDCILVIVKQAISQKGFGLTIAHLYKQSKGVNTMQFNSQKPQNGLFGNEQYWSQKQYQSQKQKDIVHVNDMVVRETATNLSQADSNRRLRKVEIKP